MIFWYLSRTLLPGALTYATLTLVAPFLPIGCNIDGDCSVRFSDGSDACDGGPIEARELEGEWCTSDLSTCLTVVSRAPGTDAPIFYEWITPTCGEDGYLSGGLEFSPRQTGAAQCWAQASAGFYSASADWTEHGIRLFIDGEPRPIDLWYQS